MSSLSATFGPDRPNASLRPWERARPWSRRSTACSPWRTNNADATAVDVTSRIARPGDGWHAESCHPVGNVACDPGVTLRLSSRPMTKREVDRRVPVLSSFRFEQRNERGQRHRCDAVLSRVFAGKRAPGLERPRSLRTNGSCFEQSFRSGHNSCPPARRRDTARIASNKLDSQPLTRFFGDRDAEIVVGPVPNGTVYTGCGPLVSAGRNDRRYQRRCPCVETARFPFSASHGQWGI